MTMQIVLIKPNVFKFLEAHMSSLKKPTNRWWKVPTSPARRSILPLDPCSKPKSVPSVGNENMSSPKKSTSPCRLVPTVPTIPWLLLATNPDRRSILGIKKLNERIPLAPEPVRNFGSDEHASYPRKEEKVEMHKIVLHWIDGGTLMERWRIDAGILAYLIFECGLTAWDVQRVKWVDPNPGKLAFIEPGAFLKRSDWGMLTASPIEDQKRIVSGMVKFDVDDIEAFESEHKELVTNSKAVPPENKSQDTQIEVSKQRLSQKHREICRRVAKEIWAKDPTRTIESLVNDYELIGPCDNKIYTEKTMRNWIKDLCPDRKPGRRPNTM